MNEQVKGVFPSGNDLRQEWRLVIVVWIIRSVLLGFLFDKMYLFL